MISPPREIKALFDPSATRKTDADLLRLANADVSSPRRRGPGGGPPDPGGPGRSESNAPSATATGDPSATTPGPRPEGRGASGALQIQTEKWQMAYDEGAAVVVEPGRGDGGTVFVQSAIMPRKADPASRAPGAERSNPF
ncbi:MAG TPA: hypothetical protein VM260_09910, partial [Pirellula sp.]|nr:hypothetical protein [Pirellula sp.]